MKAIVYAIEIHCQGTQELVSVDEQLERITQFAKRYNIDIIDTIIDEGNSLDDYRERPGIQTLLNRVNEYDIVLVERAWVFSRSAKNIKPFMDDLQNNGKAIVMATVMWDCVSQVVRRFFKATESEIKGMPIKDKMPLTTKPKSPQKPEKISWIKKVFNKAA